MNISHVCAYWATVTCDSIVTISSPVTELKYNLFLVNMSLFFLRLLLPVIAYIVNVCLPSFSSARVLLYSVQTAVFQWQVRAKQTNKFQQVSPVIAVSYLCKNLNHTRALSNSLLVEQVQT